MKRTARQFGLIAIALVIAFTMTACSRSGNNSRSGGGTPASVDELDRMIESYGSSNEIIFSLDKKSPTSFTLTVEGANWSSNINWGGEHSFITLSAVMKFSSSSVIPSSHSKTSNNVITSEVEYNSEMLNDKATVTLGGNMTGFGAIATDGGMRTGYTVNPDKNSISFP